MMLNFKPSKLTLALLSTGLLSISSHVFAEDDTVADDVEVIEVTGIRGSLLRAQAIKKSETSIVEVISAEDIGKLPDTSIAESLARLPGVTGERRNGRTSGLSLRGFNENYIGTTLNGRELLGMGDNRGVEFDLYPTEIVSNIVVYKTPEAGLTTQGVGGSIDLRTTNPLNATETMTLNGSFEKNANESGNPDYDNKGHRLSFNLVEKFADDTVGLALVVSSQETPRQEEQFRAWGYADVNVTPAGEEGHNSRRLTDTVQASAGDVILGGHDSYTRSALMERNSIAAVLQYQPNEKLKLQLDALYIDFEENDIKRGLEEGAAEWGTSDYNITGIDSGVVTSGFHDGFHSVIRNDARQQKAELTTLGLNAEYQINADWVLEFDVSTGEVKKTITDVESYSGAGRAGIDGRPLAARSFTMTSTGVMFDDHPTIAPVDYTDANLVRLAGPQAWGGALSPVAAFQGNADFAPNTAQDGFVNQPKFDENLDSLRVEVSGVLDSGIFSHITAGLNYSDRSKTKVNDGAFLTAPTWPSDGPIPNPLGVADLSFIGIDGVVAYDSLALYKSGYYTETAASLLENGRAGDSYTVEEEILTLYSKLDIETEIGDIYVSGNIGLQVVKVDQSSIGFDTFTGSDEFTVATPVSGGASYTDVLPTLNLSFEIFEDQFIRTGLSKVISRPRLDDLRANNSVSFQFNDSNILNSDPENGPWTNTKGNPELKPLEVDQFDLSYEYYFEDEGYIAASFFYKDLKNWHRNGGSIEDFSEYYIDGYHQSSADSGNQAPATFLGSSTFTEDGLTGFVRGHELQASMPLNMLHNSLNGFGVIMSATFLDGELSDGNGVPGLSDESYSFTAYYESNGFEVRISGTKRDEFITEVRGLSLALTDSVDQGAQLWDAQLGYDFAESGISSLKGLRVTLQAQNLTDEDTEQRDSNGNLTQYQSFGANYSLGFNYQF